jgi:hypothetical protein
LTGNRPCVAVRLAGLAILIHLTVSGVMLTLLGDPYIEDGGAIIFKIHPGSYIAYVAGTYMLAGKMTSRRAAWCWLWTNRATMASIVCLCACVVLEALFTGTGNPIVLIDTFLPACFLLIVASNARPNEKTLLRKILLVGFAANALIAFAETIFQTHLLPPLIEYKNDFDRDEEFRAMALYDHPLTGAAASVMGLLMATALRQAAVRVVYWLLMAAAIICFGGRVALATGVIATVLPHGYALIRALALRQRWAPWLLIANFSISSAMAAAFAIAFLAGFAARLQNHSYWDPSAQVRIAQWHILASLNEREWLFGSSRVDFLAYLHMLDLSLGVPVIECFWLLLFSSLGIIGFPLFVLGVGALLVVCWQRSSARAKAMIAVILIITSTSNSLGRKSSLLLLLVAACSVSQATPEPFRGRIPRSFTGSEAIV